MESGENCKFTIFDKVINGKSYYYARFINMDLDVYKKLNDFEKETFYGMEMTNGKQSTVFYKNPEKLESDIKKIYGREYLESEM